MLAIAAQEAIRLVLITGLSGAGKSHALNSFEDIGYYCIDNIPPTLIPKIIDLFLQSENKKIALVCDMRGAAFFADLFPILQEIQARGFELEILFLNASDDILIRRFKETRRRHPLGDLSLPAAIKKEREILSELRGRADREIDTSSLKPWELKNQIVDYFEPATREKNTTIRILSFGFKYGLPSHADLVFDVRFLPNPYYVGHLKPLSGEDDPVIEYVWRWEESKLFFEKARDLLNFTIPLYLREGKASLVVAIGCTGGRHRSVVMADELGRTLGGRYNLAVEHRDIAKN